MHKLFSLFFTGETFHCFLIRIYVCVSIILPELIMVQDKTKSFFGCPGCQSGTGIPDGSFEATFVTLYTE